MHAEVLPNLKNNHETAMDDSHGEARTRWVVVLTAAMMLVELVVGQLTGSMALLADGFHMATTSGRLDFPLLRTGLLERVQDTEYSLLALERSTRLPDIRAPCVWRWSHSSWGSNRPLDLSIP